MTRERIAALLLTAAFVFGAVGFIPFIGPQTAEAAAYPGSGDWIIAEPTYLNDTSLEVAGNIYIEAGGALYLDNTTLTFTGNDSSSTYWLQINDGGLLEIKDTTLTAEENDTLYLIEDPLASLSAEASNLYTEGIYLYSGDSVINGSFVSSKYYGIVIENCSAHLTNTTIVSEYQGVKMSNSADVTIADNEFYAATDNGFAREGIQATGSSGIIRNNTFTRISSGIALDAESGFDITGNFFDHVNSSITVGTNSAARIEDNVMWGSVNESWNFGIFSYGHNVEIKNNTIINGSTGIYVASGFANITGNVITQSHYYGIYLSRLGIYSYFDGIEGEIRNNYITDISEGIGIGVDWASSKIENNTIARSGWGLSLTNMTGVIKNNLITQNDIGIELALMSMDGVNLDSNNIYNNTEWGIHFDNMDHFDVSSLSNNFTGPGGEENGYGLMWATRDVEVFVRDTNSNPIYLSGITFPGYFLNIHWEGGRHIVSDLTTYKLFNNGTEEYPSYTFKTEWTGSAGTLTNTTTIIPGLTEVYQYMVTLDIGPDLSVTDITLSDSQIDFGQSVTATIEIFNRGAFDVVDVPVRFYANDFFVANKTIPAIGSNSHATITFEWTADQSGEVNLSVAVDPTHQVENDPFYFDVENNNAQETVTVTGGPASAGDTDTSVVQGGLVLVIVLEVLITLNLLGRLRRKDD